MPGRAGCNCPRALILAWPPFAKQDLQRPNRGVPNGDRYEKHRIRHLTRTRRPARSSMEMLHRSGAHEAVVGAERLHCRCFKDGSPSGRHLPLRVSRRRTGRRCGASLSFAKSFRPNAWTSSAHFPMRKAGLRGIPATSPGRSRCIRRSLLKNCRAAKQNSPSAGPRTTRRLKSRRCLILRIKA